MSSGDIATAGEALGFSDAEIHNAVNDFEFYGQDGDGYITCCRKDPQEWSNEILKTIFMDIFAKNPQANEIYILN